MSVDAEIEALRREWQSETPAIPELGSKVKRESRFMRMMLAGDVLVTIVIGGYVAGWAARSPRADVIVLAVAVWVFLGIAWAFALTNRRGCWGPAALNTTAFLDVSIRRRRAGIAAATFGTVLYFCEALFSLGWIYHHKSQEMLLSLGAFMASAPVIIVLVCTPVFIAFVIWYRRKKLSELAYLLKLRDATTESLS